MDSSSDLSSSIGGAVGFAFRLTGGSILGSLEARGALLGAGRAGSGGGPWGGDRVPKANVGCQNRLCCGEACVSHWLSNSWNPGVCVKATCLLTDSIYSLAVSDNGGIGAGTGILGLGFAGVGEVVGGDGMTGAGFAGRGGISEVSIGIGAWTSGVDTNSGTGVEVDSGIGVGASGCGLFASDVLASNPGAGLPPDSSDWFVLRIVGVWRFCNNSVGGRSGKSVGSGTFSNGIRLP